MPKLFFFDLQTTGTNPAKHGIHQISGIIEIDGVRANSFDFKVQPNPHSIIDPEALRIGNVTEDQLKAYPPMTDVYEKLTALLLLYVDKFDKNDKFFLVGYNNAVFDNQFLRGFFLQNGDQYFGSYFWPNSIDVMVLASQKLIRSRVGMPNFKLMTVAKQFEIEIDESKLHDGVYDCELTREIYQKIVI